jgi:hypothetical protein
MNQIRLFAGLIIAALTVASFTIQTLGRIGPNP